MKLTLNLGSVKERFSKFFDADKEKFELTPYRDWMLLIVAFLLLCILGAGIGYVSFDEVNQGDFLIESKVNVKKLRPIDTAALGALIEREHQKQAAFKEALKNPPKI